MKRLYELMQLRRPPNRLTPSEYDLYGLADRSWEEKSRYLGARAINAMASANDRRSTVLTRDKLVSGDFDVLQLAEGRGIADADWWRLCREPNGPLWRRWLVRKGPWRR